MSYSSEVFENVPIGENVVTVSAKDIDSGKLFFTAKVNVVKTLFSNICKLQYNP